jgi:hypothetical protein
MELHAFLDTGYEGEDAPRRRRPRAIRILLERGAHTDARNTGGKTAYVHALRRGFDDVCQVLEGLCAVELTEPDRLAIALVN